MSKAVNLKIDPRDNWYHFIWQKLPSLLNQQEAFVGYPNLIQEEALRLCARYLDCKINKGFDPEAPDCPLPPELERAAFLKSVADRVAKDVKGNRRLFLSRKHFSRYGGSIERLCTVLGCEVISLHELPFVDQVTTMRQANLVVSQIGSGLANVVFCNPGTRIIELCLDPDQTKVYGNLADFVGCTWERIQI